MQETLPDVAVIMRALPQPAAGSLWAGTFHRLLTCAYALQMARRLRCDTNRVRGDTQLSALPSAILEWVEHAGAASDVARLVAPPDAGPLRSWLHGFYVEAATDQLGAAPELLFESLACSDRSLRPYVSPPGDRARDWIGITGAVERWADRLGLVAIRRLASHLPTCTALSPRPPFEHFVSMGGETCHEGCILQQLHEGRFHPRHSGAPVPEGFAHGDTDFWYGVTYNAFELIAAGYREAAIRFPG